MKISVNWLLNGRSNVNIKLILIISITEYTPVGFWYLKNGSNMFNDYHSSTGFTEKNPPKNIISVR